MCENNIVHGIEPMIPIPRDKSLGKLILEKLKEHGNEICMVDAITKNKVTFKQMLEKTIRAAESLKSIGLVKNDVISVSSENHLNFYVPVIAAIYLGIIVAPLNHNYTIQEFKHTMSISKPKAIFCNSAIVEKILKLKKDVPFLQHVITLESDVKIFNVENLEEFLCRSPIVTDMYAHNIVIDCDPNEQLLLILSSSGTTGLPKGVMLTHLNLLTNLSYQEDPRFKFQEDGKEHTAGLGLLPFFHAYGFIIVFSAIIRGSQVIVMKKFEERLFLQTVQDYKIDTLALVPPLLVFLAKSPLVDEYDLSSVKLVGCGAAPLSKEIQQAVQKRLKVEYIRQGYGLTETTLAVTISPTQFSLSKEKVGSSGVLVPHMQCKIVDVETGKALGPNQRGELCFKGPLLMKGYLGNSEATMATFDEDGWLHTGDVGYYDKDKYFYIVDRIKELIKYKGFQVAPAELESVLLTNANIKDAAVIGIPDEKSGELPVAFVVKQPGKVISAIEVQQYVAGKVSRHKHLHGGVIFIEEIPKNPSGKILRRKLRDMINKKSKL